MELDLGLVESESLVGRLKLLHLLDKQSPFRDNQENAEIRISQSLQMLPNKFRFPALAIFGSTYYISKQMLTDAWKYLWNSFCTSTGKTSVRDCLILELDRDSLRDEFYFSNSLVGRLQDNSPIKSASDILEFLMAVESNSLRPELKSALTVLKKPCWVLLSDQSLSGTSVASELDRLERIYKLIFPGKEATITALIQILTEQAKLKINQTCPKANFISALNIPTMCALNCKEYSLIKDKILVGQMRELCRWFGQNIILKTNYRIAKLSLDEKNPDIANYGFGCMGWNIVTYKNTPNNSLPLLWFRPPNDIYRPPFERIDSRYGDTWAGRRQWLEKIEIDQERRSKLLKKISRIRELQ